MTEPHLKALTEITAKEFIQMYDSEGLLPSCGSIYVTGKGTTCAVGIVLIKKLGRQYRARANELFRLREAMGPEVSGFELGFDNGFVNNRVISASKGFAKGWKIGRQLYKHYYGSSLKRLARTLYERIFRRDRRQC